MRSVALFGPNSKFVSLCAAVEWNDKQLCQLHQWTLWREEVGGDASGWPNLPAALRARSDSAFRLASVNPSRFQRSVGYALDSLGLQAAQEVRVTQGYSIDLTVEWGGRRVGVEVDGPSHFTADGRPTGSTELKRRQLRHFGWALLSVPYWEWEEMRDTDKFATRQAQCAYLAKSLDEATGLKLTASGDGWVAIDCTCLVEGFGIVLYSRV